MDIPREVTYHQKSRMVVDASLPCSRGSAGCPDYLDIMETGMLNLRRHGPVPAPSAMPA
jgi:hypothetical protein